MMNRTYTNSETSNYCRIKNDLLPDDYILDDYYYNIHQFMVIPCIDIFIRYNNGILLIKRRYEPAKNEFWCVGGRLRKGVSELDNIHLIVKNETNLDIVGVIYFLGIARTMFKESPYSHGKGTDSRNTVYLVSAEGKLEFDKTIEDYLMFTYEDFADGLHKELHQYIRDYLEQIFNGGYFY